MVRSIEKMRLQESIPINGFKKSSSAKRLAAVPSVGFLAESADIQRKPACACGGGCPACQSKSALNVSQPNDPAEIEADQIAEKVMRMAVDDAKPQSTSSNPQTTIHRKCDSCEDENQEVSENSLMRKKNLAPAATTPPPSDAPTSINNVINSGGQPLDTQTRSFFEPRFGTDLSHVRVHTDAFAAQTARSISAKAYTLGSNIVFGTGEYQPDSESANHLLAHELAHVTQSRNSTINRQTIYRQPNDVSKPVTASPTLGNLPRDNTVPAIKLKLKYLDGAWREVKPSMAGRGNVKWSRASGWYDFVLKDGEIWAIKRSAKIETEPGERRPGHTEAAGGDRVTWAGQVRFTKSGQVAEWNDGSGHYRSASSLKEPVVEAGFPADKFKQHPDVAAERKAPSPGKGPQLPVFQPETKSRDGSPAKIPAGPPRAFPPSGQPSGGAQAATPITQPGTKAELGSPIKPTVEATPGFRPARGAGFGSAFQVLQAMQFGNLQQAEIAKFEKRLAELEPKIDAYFAKGYSVELVLIVEKPDRPDLFCAAGVICDAGQFIYFRELFISYAESVKPVLRTAPPTSHATMGPPGGRSGEIPYTHQGGSIIDIEEIPFLTPKHADHHCEFAKQTIYPPDNSFLSFPGVPSQQARPEIQKPQLDQAALEALAAAPARVYVTSENIIQYKTADRIMKKLAGNPMFGELKESMGGSRSKYTIVAYWSDLEKSRAEALAEILRSEGVPSVRAERFNHQHGDNPGYLQINIGRDAEKESP